MDRLAEQIKESKSKISKMEFEIAVEHAVLLRLIAMQNGDKSEDSDKSRPIIADSIVPQIQSVLKAKSKPMKNNQILESLDQQGFKFEGKTEPKRLIQSALIRRGDLFERIGRGLYQIRYQEQLIDTREL